MKKVFVLFFLIFSFIKMNAYVVYSLPSVPFNKWIIPVKYGCADDQSYLKIGFSPISQVNNDYFEIRRSTDMDFESGYSTVGGHINGCGTCGGSPVYEVIDNGPFVSGVTYYYEIRATDNFGFEGIPVYLSSYTPLLPSTVNWVSQVTSSFESSSTPTSENSYSWGAESRSTQGTNIDLAHTEISKVYIEQNNNKINFIDNVSLPFVNIDVNIDNAGYFNIYNGSPTASFEWTNCASYFTAIGTHQLFVNFIGTSSGTIFHREYTFYVVPKSDGLYKDNYCNTMRVWKNPSGMQGIPLILSEGFDAYNTKPEQYYRQAGKDLMDCLLKKGFDIYIINYKYNSQDIRSNAADFSSAIRYVSSINGNLPVIAAGISMGGIINRYACAKAENDGVPLPISKFLTLDAPHQGAVISSTLQDWRKSKTSGDTYAENASNNLAAKELLNYNAYDPTASIHNTFYSELNSLNGDGYPHLVPKIGVSFSSSAANPNSGEWLFVNVNGIPGNYNKHIDLTPEELVAGSYLPGVNIDPMPVTAPGFWASAMTSVLRPFSDPTVSITQFKNPTFISHNSSLDIISGVSKFDIVIQPATTSFHDIIPSDIIEPILNSLINKDLYLQNKTVIDIKNYIASNKIEAGNNVTSAIPTGNFILASSSTVTMTAGNQIKLSDGFSVLTGSSFDAKIGPVYCDGVQSTQFRNAHTNSTIETVYENSETEYKDVEGTNLNEEKVLIKSNALRIYPNPTENSFIVETELLSKQIAVYNITGIEIITNSNIESLQTKIDLSSHPKGIYLIKIIGSDDTISIQKIIKL